MYEGYWVVGPNKAGYNVKHGWKLKLLRVYKIDLVISIDRGQRTRRSYNNTDADMENRILMEFEQRAIGMRETNAKEGGGG